MIDEAIHNVLKNSDEYIKIFIIIWIKIREIYLDYNKNDKVSLHKRIDSLSNFCRVIRKRAEKTPKLASLSKFLKFIEMECKTNREKIDKLYNITALLKMFDLPKPVNDVIDSLGLNSGDDNEFANVINELFEEDINFKKLEGTNNEEGTLFEYINKKYDKGFSDKDSDSLKKFNQLQDIPIGTPKIQEKQFTIIKNKQNENTLTQTKESTNNKSNYQPVYQPIIMTQPNQPMMIAQQIQSGNQPIYYVPVMYNQQMQPVQQVQQVQPVQSVQSVQSVQPVQAVKSVQVKNVERGEKVEGRRMLSKDFFSDGKRVNFMNYGKVR